MGRRVGRITSLRAGAGVLVAAAFAIAAAPSVAFAYIGPGAGLGAIGSVMALIGAVFLGILGFIWYPIKKLIRLARKALTRDRP